MKLSLIKPLAIFLTLLTLTFSSIGVLPAYAAATLTVINIDDSGAGSLRQAIEDAESGDTIIFDAGLSGQTIHLADSLTLSKGMTIDGSTLASQITISGDTDNDGTGNVGVLKTESGITATLKNLTIVKGLVSKTPNAGGGILNKGTLTIMNSTISGNLVPSTVGSGGGIYNNGILTVINSTLTDNSVSNGDGGGIINWGVLTITNSTFSNNSAGYGGGIINMGVATVANSTFSGNSATHSGGAISNSWATLTVTNSTFSNNSAEYGGGIISGTNINLLTVRNNTFSNNIALKNIGGGIYKTGDGMNYANNIIANSTGSDCYYTGTIITNIKNLVEDGSCSASLSGDPKLAPLANNGGPTQTMALQTGSSAIDAGDDAICSASPVNSLDQRGITRPQGTHCDIGAYEGSVAATGSTFADVPADYWAWQYIEDLYAAGITGGCNTSPLMYCPLNPVTRAQMAIFILRGMHGSAYTPPAATGTIFSDVSVTTFGAAWIEQFASEGITSGCGSGMYCPDANVTRSQMAIFLLKGEHGSSFVPPVATGIFPDVPVGSFAADWIEQLAAEGITSGCGGGNYCPNANVTRDQMAVFLVRAFNLP